MFSLFGVILLMYIALKILQKYSKFGTITGNKKLNLKIDSVVYIDQNTKVVHLYKDKRYYILAVGKNNIMLIDKYDTN